MYPVRSTMLYGYYPRLAPLRHWRRSEIVYQDPAKLYFTSIGCPGSSTHDCSSNSTTAAGPLLGPALHRIRCTPQPRLWIVYRDEPVHYDPAPQCHPILNGPPCPPCEQLEKIPDQNDLPHAQPCGKSQRHLGNALLLDRLLTGGNQNEKLPLLNQRVLEMQRNDCGKFFDACI